MDNDLISFILTHIEVAIIKKLRATKNNQVLYYQKKTQPSILALLFAPPDDFKYQGNQIRCPILVKDLQKYSQDLLNTVEKFSYSQPSPAYFMMIPTLEHLVINIAWSWRDASNTVLTKRLKKILSSYYQLKLDDNFYSVLGSYLKDYLLDNKTYYFDYTSQFDWVSGEFGDAGSCYFNNKASRGALQLMEKLKYFHAIRFFKNIPIPKAVKALFINYNNHQELYHHMQLFRIWGIARSFTEYLAPLISQINSSPTNKEIVVQIRKGLLNVNFLPTDPKQPETSPWTTSSNVSSLDLWKLFSDVLHDTVRNIQSSPLKYSQSSYALMTYYQLAFAINSQTFEEFLYLYNTQPIYLKDQNPITMEQYFAPIYQKYYEFLQAGRDGSAAPIPGYLPNSDIRLLFMHLYSMILQYIKRYANLYGYDADGRKYSEKEIDDLRYKLNEVSPDLDLLSVYYNFTTEKWTVYSDRREALESAKTLDAFFRYNDQNNLYVGTARTFVLDPPKDFIRKFFKIEIKDDEPFYLLYNSYGIPLHKTANLFGLLTSGVTKKLRTIWRDNKFAGILYINEDIVAVSSSFVINQLKDEIAFDNLVTKLEDYVNKLAHSKPSEAASPRSRVLNNIGDDVVLTTTTMGPTQIQLNVDNAFWPER